jgi:hypothetical protein
MAISWVRQMTQTCFVIQPFDGAEYDKRYRETYKPAIELAGLEPYRIDEDPSASILIEQIEKRIRNAAICFAEITENNPNVWFELGMAIAFGKEVCLVCNDKRSSFPFDVQHRNIIRYSTLASSDFEALKTKISLRLVAITEKQENLSTLPRPILVEPREPGELSGFEIACIGVIASNSASDGEAITIYDLRKEMAQAGYTSIATNVAVRALLRRGYISIRNEADYDQNYHSVFIQNSGWEWVEKNIGHFTLRELPATKDTTLDDDIPF